MKKKEQNVMRETIVRNRQALGRNGGETEEVIVDGLEGVNNTVSLDVIEKCGDYGVGYILADGFIVGYGEPTP